MTERICVEIGGNRSIDGWRSIGNRNNVSKIVNIITDDIDEDDEGVDYFYMSHVIEHIPIPNAEGVLKKLHKKLKPGGKLRIVCPDLAFILKAYQERNSSVFNNSSYQLGTVPESYSRLGIGGFVVGQNVTGMIGDENDSYLFTKRNGGDYVCTFSHVSAWDFEMLRNLLTIVGFSSVIQTDLEDIDPHRKEGQLCVNAFK